MKIHFSLENFPKQTFVSETDLSLCDFNRLPLGPSQKYERHLQTVEEVVYLSPDTFQYVLTTFSKGALL